MLTELKIPTTYFEADDRCRVIVAEIEEIEAQLGDGLKRETMASDEDYFSWRNKAVWARTNRLQELRFLRQCIRHNTIEDELEE